MTGRYHCWGFCSAAVLVLCVLSSTALASLEQGLRFNVDVAERGWWYSRTATCGTDEITQWNCGEVCQLNPTFQARAVHVNNDMGTLAYTGINPSKEEIVVVFRAAANLQNWIATLDFDLIPFSANATITPIDVQQWKVHRGFQQSYLSLRDGVLADVAALTAQFPEYTLFVTGHSLGGAMATLCAMDLAIVDWPIVNRHSLVNDEMLLTSGTSASSDRSGFTSSGHVISSSASSEGSKSSSSHRNVTPSKSSEGSESSETHSSDGSKASSFSHHHVSSSSSSESSGISSSNGIGSTSSHHIGSSNSPSDSSSKASSSNIHGSGSQSASGVSSSSSEAPLPLPRPTIAVYTYGSPRVGNSAFTLAAATLLWTGRNTHFRVTHGGDAVPLLPPQKFDYFHAATEVYYRDTNHTSRHGYSLCGDTGATEDDRCSIGAGGSAPADHLVYMGSCASCDCAPTGMEAPAEALTLTWTQREHITDEHAEHFTAW